MSVLEGYGGSAGLPAWVEEIVEAGAVAVFIDNAGFVWAHRKGSSRDEYIWTLAKFMEDFCKGLGVRVKLFHTGRRTSKGERIADALSKGNMKEVKEEMPEGVDVSDRCSRVLDRWMKDPRVDRDLARRVLGEVQGKVDVFIGRNVTLEMEEMLREKKLE